MMFFRQPFQGYLDVEHSKTPGCHRGLLRVNSYGVFMVKTVLGAKVMKNEMHLYSVSQKFTESETLLYLSLQLIFLQPLQGCCAAGCTEAPG
jgi:hypothetical protein